MTIAVIAASYLGEYPEAAVVIDSKISFKTNDVNCLGKGAFS